MEGGDDLSESGVRSDRVQVAEDAIRRYLTFLEDPGALVDRDAVVEARRVAKEKPDPIDRLLALEAVRRMETIDPDVVRAPFVRSVKLWADSVGVHWQTLLNAGVPRRDLVDAGFELVSASESSGRRRSRVTVQAVIDFALSAPHPVTAQGLVALSGASVGTVRKAIDQMLAEERLIEVGPDRTRSARGKPAQRYTCPG